MKHRQLSKYQKQYAGEYLMSTHWEKLKKQHIYSKSDVKCWICSHKRSLLLHHENYTNLYKEQFEKDIFVLCYNCHTQLHFSTFLFFFKRKTPLIPKYLKRRRLFLRLRFCTRNGQVGLIIWFLIRYILNR